MDAAYVFGHLGNVVAALGQGWSIEDEFAWAVGAESVLTLPLPSDNCAYTLRCDVHPALYPPNVTRQRLAVKVNGQDIGSFEITRRGSIAITLPAALTRGQGQVVLHLRHPDASRPRDHLDSPDGRLLALCFHSATLTAAGSGEEAAGSDAAPRERMHAIVAGGATAMRIREIVGKLPSLSRWLSVHFIDLSIPLAALPPGALDAAAFCWIEGNAGTQAAREGLRAALPAGCAVRLFQAPTCQSLWPFLGHDPRAVAESGRYHPARYPFGDRLAQPLAAMNMPDDVVYLMYEMSVEQERVDLDAVFRSDLRRWHAEDATTDLSLAAFIERGFSTGRMFISPNLVGPALMREMVRQVLADSALRDLVGNRDLASELDALLDGYAGWEEELPVHKRVADHFGLAWWSPEMKYRWMNNLRTYRIFTLDYIRWTAWRT